MNTLFVTSEVSPYSNTGGLSQVTASLPKALKGLGQHVSVLSPFYRLTKERLGTLSHPLEPLRIQMGTKTWEGMLLSYIGPDQIRYLFLDIPELFDRAGFYGEAEQAYEDNPLRYAVLSRAAIDILNQYDMPFDLLHSHDWQGGLVPYYLSRERNTNLRLAGVASVFTIHNLAYQGTTPMHMAAELGIDPAHTGTDGLEFYGNLSLLKAGIIFGDTVTTVSPSYAREICTPEHGMMMDGVLRTRQDDLYGILNGVDYQVWSPERDQHLLANYDTYNHNGKRRCKANLQSSFKLKLRPRTPLVGVVSRLTEQKGIDLLVKAVRPRLEAGLMQLFILGEGNNGLVEACCELAHEFPGWAAVSIGYSEALAHQVFAAADIFAMPSRFEPCGLAQLFALRYGAIPIVRDTGGLHDTVHPFDSESMSGNGFVFSEPSANALAAELDRSLALFQEVRRWRGLVHNAMTIDYSWSKAAREYQQVYEKTHTRSISSLIQGSRPSMPLLPFPLMAPRP